MWNQVADLELDGALIAVGCNPAHGWRLPLEGEWKRRKIPPNPACEWIREKSKKPPACRQRYFFAGLAGA